MEHWIHRMAAIAGVIGGLLVIIGGSPLHGTAITSWAFVALVQNELWRRSAEQAESAFQWQMAHLALGFGKDYTVFGDVEESQ